MVVKVDRKSSGLRIVNNHSNYGPINDRKQLGYFRSTYGSMFPIDRNSHPFQ